MPDYSISGLGETNYNIVRRVGYDIGDNTTLVECAVVDRCKVKRIHMTVETAISADTLLTLSNANESQEIDTFTLLDTVGAGDTIVWIVKPDDSINHFAAGDRLSIATNGSAGSSFVNTVVVTGRGGTSKGANDIVALGDNIIVASGILDIGTATGFERNFIYFPPQSYVRRIVINQDDTIDADTELELNYVAGGQPQYTFTMVAGGSANTVQIFQLPNDEKADLRASEHNIFVLTSDLAAADATFVLVSLVFDVT